MHEIQIDEPETVKVFNPSQGDYLLVVLDENTSPVLWDRMRQALPEEVNVVMIHENMLPTTLKGPKGLNVEEFQAMWKKFCLSVEEGK